MGLATSNAAELVIHPTTQPRTTAIVDAAARPFGREPRAVPVGAIRTGMPTSAKALRTAPAAGAGTAATARWPPEARWTASARVSPGRTAFKRSATPARSRALRGGRTNASALFSWPAHGRHKPRSSAFSPPHTGQEPTSIPVLGTPPRARPSGGTSWTESSVGKAIGVVTRLISPRSPIACSERPWSTRRRARTPRGTSSGSPRRDPSVRARSGPRRRGTGPCNDWARTRPPSP